MNDLNSNGDSNSTVTSNNSSTDDVDSDQYSIDYLQSSSKDGLRRIWRWINENKSVCLVLDLIKYVLSLQQQNSMKLIQMNQIHSQSIQQLKSQVTKKQNSLDNEPLS